MATSYSKGPYWQSLLIFVLSQVQRNGCFKQVLNYFTSISMYFRYLSCLFSTHAALTHASVDEQIMYVMTKELTRIPPTHSLPSVETGNIANIISLSRTRL